MCSCCFFLGAPSASLSSDLLFPGLFSITTIRHQYKTYGFYGQHLAQLDFHPASNTKHSWCLVVELCTHTTTPARTTLCANHFVDTSCATHTHTARYRTAYLAHLYTMVCNSQKHMLDQTHVCKYWIFGKPHTSHAVQANCTDTPPACLTTKYAQLDQHKSNHQPAALLPGRRRKCRQHREPSSLGKPDRCMVGVSPEA
jgi:hypothetical protein